MKKLSILIALMLCVTISGVYATWSYASTNDIADSFAEAKVTLADAEYTGSSGVFKIESNLALSVDQANEDHEAELVFLSNDTNPIYLKVTFTPASNASNDIKDNGVPAELHFDTTTTMEYKMDAQGNYDENGTATKVFKFDHPASTSFAPNITWTKEANGSFTYTMDETALKNQIALTQTFVLDTIAEHTAFRNAITGNIKAHVTDGIYN